MQATLEKPVIGSFQSAIDFFLSDECRASNDGYWIITLNMSREITAAHQIPVDADLNIFNVHSHVKPRLHLSMKAFYVVHYKKDGCGLEELDLRLARFLTFLARIYSKTFIDYIVATAGSHLSFRKHGMI